MKLPTKKENNLPMQSHAIDDNFSSSLVAKANDDLLFDNQISREWLSTKEAARYLRITSNALRILVCRGKVEYFKLGGRLRFRMNDLEALLQKKEMFYEY